MFASRKFRRAAKSGGDSSWANTKLLLHADGSNGSTTITDSTGLNTITVSGNAQISTAQSKFGGSSMYFDGINSGLSTPDSENFNLGVENFTIECWVRPADITNYKAFVAHWGFGASGNLGWVLRQYNNKFSFVYTSNGTTEVPTTGATSYSINNWYHVAAVRNGTSFMLFVNGVLDASTTSSASVFHSTLALGLGRAGAGDYFNGYIDEVRITKGVARYTANFTPPSEPFPNS